MSDEDPIGNVGLQKSEKDAAKPVTEAVTANIGSGPFKFNHALAKPGASFAYDRNEKYVPRSEPSDGFAGGKIVKVDRVIWDLIGDQQTALAALQAGEIDFLEGPPADFYPAIESDPNLALQVLDTSGQVYYLRMNCLQKPFDNVKARQAVLHLVNQEAYLNVISSDPKYSSTVTSFSETAIRYQTMKILDGTKRAAIHPAKLSDGSYRSQWWVTHNELGAVETRGIHGQRLYIAPEAEMVVARFASHPLASAEAGDIITMPQMLALGRMLRG